MSIPDRSIRECSNCYYMRPFPPGVRADDKVDCRFHAPGAEVGFVGENYEAACIVPPDYWCGQWKGVNIPCAWCSEEIEREIGEKAHTYAGSGPLCWTCHTRAANALSRMGTPEDREWLRGHVKPTRCAPQP